MLLAYLKRQYKLLLLLAGAVCIFAAVFALYDLPLEAVLYAGALCLALGLVLFAVGYSRFLRRHRELQRLLRQAGEKALSDVREGDLAAFRRSHLGFVFQDFNLLDIFSLRDNIFLPLVLAGRPYEEMERKLKPLAEQLGIADILIKYPYEVSGGQKQRAAVARALITDPQIVLADEPTGALDSRSSDNLLELFGEINKGGQTILMVTHSVKAASHAGRVLFLRDGRVYHQLYRGSESREAQFRRISDTLTVLTQGGENHG